MQEELAKQLKVNQATVWDCMRQEK